jgi:hypothetical protein
MKTKGVAGNRFCCKSASLHQPIKIIPISSEKIFISKLKYTHNNPVNGTYVHILKNINGAV